MRRNQFYNSGWNLFHYEKYPSGDVSLIPGSGRFSGRRYGNTLQYSCLKNPMGREAWWALVHRDAKNWMQLKQLCMHACMETYVVFSCISQILLFGHIRKYTSSLLAFRHGNMINSFQRKVRNGNE